MSAIFYEHTRYSFAKTKGIAHAAINQKNYFTLTNDNKFKTNTNSSFYTKMDLEIAKYYFELDTRTEKLNGYKLKKR